MHTIKMLNEKQIAIIHRALESFGSVNELVVTIEELSELQKEVTKFLRNQGSVENVIEELSDVYIVLEYLKIIFAIDDESVSKEIDYKLNRLTQILKD